MVTEHIDNTLEEFLNELEADSPHEQIESVLASYTSQSWENWLNDIIQHGIGYPISNLSPVGDVIIDMPDLLRVNQISTAHYELAVGTLLSRTYYENPENILLLERLINAYVALSGYTANDILIKILTLPNYTNRAGANNYIKTIALLALSKSSKLEDKHKRDIISYIVLKGLDEMSRDPYFFSTTLRFCYIQISGNAFFSLLTIILIKVDQLADTNLKGVLQPLLLDKIEELYAGKFPSFYSDLFHWLISISGLGCYSKFESNVMTKHLLLGITGLIKSGDIEIQTLTIQELQIEIYKPVYSILFLLSILTEEDISPSKIFDDPEMLVYTINNIITDNHENEKLLFSLIKAHLNFVLNTQVRILPELNHLFQIKINTDELNTILIFPSQQYTSSKEAIIKNCSFTQN